MEHYETFSTTADVGIYISGNNYSELYNSAIKGLNLLYFDEFLDTQESITKTDFFYEGDSLENILVNLLTEVFYLIQYERKYISGITINKADDHLLDGFLHVSELDREPGIEIKSVTYHNLHVLKENNTLSTGIIFDV